MRASIDTGHTNSAAIARVGRAFVLLIAALMVAFLAFAYNPYNAYADQPAASEPAAQVQNSAESSAAAASEDEEVIEESIEDEDVPLADGTTMKRSTLGGLHWFIVAGIVVVGGFFLVSTGRLNRNINKMEHFIK